MNEKRLFNDGWSFTLLEVKAPAPQPNQTAWNPPVDASLEIVQSRETQWNLVEIPHDWLIYDTANLYKWGEGWYRKEMFVSSSDIQAKRMFLRFDGVYMDSAVFVNGKTAFVWKYGYSAFEAEITEYLKDGANEILVRVMHQSPNSRWYSGAGIYRNVWLKTTNKAKAHIVSDGIYITARKQSGNGDKWIVEVDTEIETSADNKNALAIRHTVIDKNGSEISSLVNNIDSASDSDSQEICVTSPELWDIDEPNLYTLKTELTEAGKVIETQENRFGFRTAEFEPEKGFILNGRITKLYGVCQHHDLGCLGSAVNKTALERQLNVLREMGVNAIRTSHNMPASELMELADKKGILIISEAFDMWEKSKTRYDYARFFCEWVEKDVASWIRRDRNCPSVIMWSIGNEIGETNSSERGQEITEMLNGLVRLHDPKNHAPVTIGSNYMAWENAQKCADIIKLAGYNYAENLYDRHHAEHPDWIIYGSETSSVVQSRGIYHFPLSQPILSDDDEQCSALGNSTTSWGGKNPEYCIIADRDAKFSAGQFLWSGFDYIGEPTPYHTKNSYFGQIDTAGFKKDSFYMYQAEWTDYKTKPMIHILPYWDFSPGQLIDVRVCSNAPKIELFLDAQSLGVFDIDHANDKKLFGDWQIAYKKGTLRAVAYDENNNIIAEDIKQSFEDAAEIILTPDKTEMLADGRDLIFVEIAAKDKNGVFVENANNRINITVSGEGRLVGLDNGDSTDFEQYKTTSRRLFSGKLLAVIASTQIHGEITFSAVSEGLTPNILKFTSVACEKQDGASPVVQQIKNCACDTQFAPNEIPIRKIELISAEGCELNENLQKITVKANIFPQNATYDDLEWRVANRSGVDSDIALLNIDETNKSVSLTALGDGEFYLRCMAKNGSQKIRLISQLGFKITGMGELAVNPYKFVSGSLYNASNTELTSGNERGVATDRVIESHVGFRNVNFGSYGSDEVTLPIFSLSGGTFPIDFWEGMPGEDGSEHLCTLMYTQGSRWNTYLEQTFKLPRRLKGITTFCIAVRLKIHIKGFLFKAAEKAYEQLNAGEYTDIYGDSFKLTEESIEEIGNNVSISFEDMDFGEKGFSKIQICGLTPLEKNTIQIKFSGEESARIVEFPNSHEYVTHEFELESVKGNQTVTFIFLPGCRFDFKWFRFMQ